MKIISVVGNKGGTGKTAIAVHLAYAIAEKKRVCFIDTDYAQWSGVRWLTGEQDKEIDEQRGDYGVEGFANLSVACMSKQNLSGSDEVNGFFCSIEGYEYYIIDGRPEPDITAGIIKLMKDGVVILPVEIGEDAIQQASDLRRVIDSSGIKCRQYAVVNKMTQSRISQTLYQEVEGLGFDILGILPFSEYVKWAEKESSPIWNIKGAGHSKISDFFRMVGRFAIGGRL